MSKRWLDIAAIVLFITLSTLLLNKALLPGYTLLPLDLIKTIAPWDNLDLGPLANRLISDPFYSFFPRRFYLTESLQAGQLPLWNPGIMAGTPTIANPNFQLFYPPNLLAALVLPAQDALPWLAWFHLSLTGSLMYLFLRRHQLHWFACLAGGGLWLLSGYNLVWLENPHRLSTVAWLPGIFWAYEAATQNKKLGWIGLGGLFYGLSILGGQAQYIFAITIMMGLYALVKLILSSQNFRRISYSSMAYMALLILIGLGIGALLILPAAEFTAISQRVRFDASNIAGTRWPLSQVISLVAPNFYGNPAGSVPYWGPGNYAETTAYFGVVALLLALTAPFIARKKDFLVYSLSLGIVTLLITLGSPLAKLLAFLPGGEYVVLGRTIFLIPFAGVWLASAGLDGWLAMMSEKPSSQKIARLTIAIAISVLAIVIISAWVVRALGDQFVNHKDTILIELGRSAFLLVVAIMILFLMLKWPKIATGLLFLILVGELFFWGRDFNPITPVEYLYPDNEVVDWLRQDNGLYRVLPLQSGKVVFGPNVLPLFGFQTPGGYTPLIQKDYVSLYKAIGDQVDIGWMRPNRNMLVMSQFKPLVSLLNVKYVLSAKRLANDIIVQGGNEGCADLLAIDEGPVTHSFMATSPGLNRYDLTFGETGIEVSPDEEVRFQLWRKAVNDELVADISMDPADILLDQSQPFFFAPVPDSTGANFEMNLTGPKSLALCQSYDGSPQFRAFGTWLQERSKEDGVWIYENPNALPRAYMVHHVIQREPDDSLDALLSPNMNYHRTGIVQETISSDLASMMSDRPIQSDSQVTIADYGAQEVSIQVDGTEAGLLILGDTNYPGWEATIDGQPVEVYTVNSIFRGVFVPSGSHDIQFTFRPTYLPISLGLAGVSLLVALVLIGITLFIPPNTKLTDYLFMRKR